MRKHPDRITEPVSLPRMTKAGRVLEQSVFPILPWRRIDSVEKDQVLIDTDVIGSAFFVTAWGAFLTAKHLVEEYEGNPLLCIMYFYEGIAGRTHLHRAEVRSLQLHPRLDVAFGVAGFDGETPRSPRPMTISMARVTNGSPVSVFGYSHTEVPKPDGPLAFWPREHAGEVLAHRAPGHDGYRGHREYVITAESLGGTSGAPVIKRDTLEVCAILNSGIADACGFATDVRDFVPSWQLDSLGGMTIAQFSRKYPRVLRVRNG